MHWSNSSIFSFFFFFFGGYFYWTLPFTLSYTSSLVPFFQICDSILYSNLTNIYLFLLLFEYTSPVLSRGSRCSENVHWNHWTERKTLCNRIYKQDRGVDVSLLTWISGHVKFHHSLSLSLLTLFSHFLRHLFASLFHRNSSLVIAWISSHQSFGDLLAYTLRNNVFMRLMYNTASGAGSAPAGIGCPAIFERMIYGSAIFTR